MGKGASPVSGRSPQEAARIARKPARRGLPDLDRVIHERMRLGIMSALAASASLTFNELKAALQTSDGNLSVHARKLEDAGYLTCIKSFEARAPKTVYRLTADGRRAFTRYLVHLEAVIAHARGK